MAQINANVKVTFIDAATNQPFAVTEMPAEDLPETFELDTTLHLGDEDWSVVNAQPRLRADYAKSNSLTLVLHRIEYVATKDILFTLPSICEAIPVAGDVTLSGDEFVLVEDDWRQFELVSKTLASDVDEQIEKIRLIHENEAEGLGWRSLHVRTKPVIPLVTEITINELARSLEHSSEPVGVAYRGGATRILDGYAMTMRGLTVYGVAPNGIVRTIAFEKYYEDSTDPALLTVVKAVALTLNADLVHWCSCAKLSPEDPRFDLLFENESSS